MPSVKTSIYNKCCSFELSIHRRIIQKCRLSVSTKILSSITVFNIDNNKKFFLSSKKGTEGSCDTEDWSNDAEVMLLNYSLK